MKRLCSWGARWRSLVGVLLPLILAAVTGVAAPESDPSSRGLAARGLGRRLLASTVRVVGAEVTGSGVVVGERFILTAAHVAGAPGQPRRVGLCDGSELAARTVGTDPERDLGLIAVDRGRLPPPASGSGTAAPASGETVVACGYTAGAFEAAALPARVITCPDSRLRRRPDLLFTDAPLVPGASGGPLFTTDGRLVGVHSMVARGARGRFAVHACALPLPDVIHDLLEAGACRESGEPGEGSSSYRPAVESLLAPTAPEPGYLGVRMEDAPPASRGAPGSAGGVLVAVLPGSPALAAGLRSGDVVVQVDGRRVACEDDLGDALLGRGSGTPLKLRVSRGGGVREFTVVLARHPLAAELRR